MGAGNVPSLRIRQIVTGHNRQSRTKSDIRSTGSRLVGFPRVEEGITFRFMRLL
jgi:hypothetical protein